MIVLAATALISNKGAVEWVGALAVALSFAHMQVTDRLAEEAARVEAAAGTATVECHRWAGRYLVGKELCWLLYFVMLGAWSALVGVGLFLFYPLWRSFYRARICHGPD